MRTSTIFDQEISVAGRAVTFFRYTDFSIDISNTYRVYYLQNISYR